MSGKSCPGCTFDNDLQIEWCEMCHHHFIGQIQNVPVHGSKKIYRTARTAIESYKKLPNNDLEEIRDLVESKLNEEKKKPDHLEHLPTEEIAVGNAMLDILTKEIARAEYNELANQIISLSSKLCVNRLERIGIEQLPNGSWDMKFTHQELVDRELVKKEIELLIVRQNALEKKIR